MKSVFVRLRSTGLQSHRLGDLEGEGRVGAPLRRGITLAQVVVGLGVDGLDVAADGARGLGERAVDLDGDLGGLAALQTQASGLQGEIDINATCDTGNTKREIRINPVDVRAERDYITTSTPEEQKKFRQWLVKLMLGLMFVMFFVVMMMATSAATATFIFSLMESMFHL